MLKIVPMLTFTSMLLLPSSGSMATTYLPPADTGWSKTMCSSFSSLATPHTAPWLRMALMKRSLAYTSNFCCFSPCTFTLCWSVSPRISFTSPALFTSRFTSLAARRIEVSNCERSPVAKGKSFSRETMNSERVVMGWAMVRGSGDRKIR